MNPLTHVPPTQKAIYPAGSVPPQAGKPLLTSASLGLSVTRVFSCGSGWVSRGLDVTHECEKKGCTLFTIARTWKQPKCPSTDEWIKKMWHIYTVEYYSAIKRNETELFVVRWMELETVIQSEVSQKEKNKYRMLTHIYGI